MHKVHVKNTVRYYLVIVLTLLFLFLSGDFGLIDVQKTAIVMAVGIDREEDTFIVTSQIAVPKSSKQGGQSETVEIVSRGRTVADAFEEINAKTGWYPKLVFCHLIILGEKTAQKNVFDALDFFLLDEYMSDDCLVATCDGFAKDMLNVAALIDPSGSVAMQKVLSPHAKRVGTVLPNTLREFAIGYYGDSKSGYLPIVKTQPQQEQIGGETSNGGAGENGGSGGAGGANGSGSSEDQSGSTSGADGENANSGGSSGSGQQGGQSKEKPVFSASETALFVGGVRVDKLTEEETFAFNAVDGDLRLAAYTVENDGATCSLTVKHNSPKTKLKLGTDGRATLKIEVVMSAGLLDYSKALSLESTSDAGEVPNGVFAASEKLLSAQIQTTFDKCRACGCDLFGIGERIQKYEKKRYAALKDSALENALADVSVKFRNIR